MVSASIKCYYSILYFLFIMAQAYENALATGQVVVRRWWFNTSSSKNQVTVQFAQAVERPASSAADANSALIALEQGTEGISNTTTVTALRSIDADRAQAFFGSTEGTLCKEVLCISPMTCTSLLVHLLMWTSQFRSRRTSRRILTRRLNSSEV